MVYSTTLRRSPEIRSVVVGEEGDPVVYLHGLGCSSLDSWAPLLHRMARPAWLVDLLGHGLSDRPHDFSYGLVDHSDAVARHLASSPGSMDVIAHSLGGSIAVMLAARHPNLVRSLVLVEPGLEAARSPSTGLGLLPDRCLSYEEWYATLAAESPDRRATLLGCDPLAVKRSAVAVDDAAGDTVLDELCSSQVPALVVLGQRHYRRQADLALAPNLRVVRIPGARHFVMRDRPVEFCAAVSEFWRAIEASASSG